MCVCVSVCFFSDDSKPCTAIDEPFAHVGFPGDVVLADLAVSQLRWHIITEGWTKFSDLISYY